jgi:methylenetetrahydrofolate reductase (NADPH)
VQKLAKQGVDTFHFYTMNRADLVFAISHLLGIRPNNAKKSAKKAAA